MDECVKAQPIVAIVGQVGHENTDLTNRKDKISQRGVNGSWKSKCAVISHIFV